MSLFKLQTQQNKTRLPIGSCPVIFFRHTSCRNVGFYLSVAPFHAPAKISTPFVQGLLFAPVDADRKQQRESSPFCFSLVLLYNTHNALSVSRKYYYCGRSVYVVIVKHFSGPYNQDCGRGCFRRKDAPTHGNCRNAAFTFAHHQYHYDHAHFPISLAHTVADTE